MAYVICLTCVVCRKVTRPVSTNQANVSALQVDTFLCRRLICSKNKSLCLLMSDVDLLVCIMHVCMQQ